MSLNNPLRQRDENERLAIEVNNLNDVQPTSNTLAPSLPVTLSDGLVPLGEDGRYVPNHLDESGTVHWFSVVVAEEGANPNGEPYQMRYFRAQQDSQSEIISDSYPVMPLTNNAGSPSPLPTLEVMLEDGDLDNAQVLASGTAQLYGLSFPNPPELQPLNLPEELNKNPDPSVEQFRNEFANSAYHLLEPFDPVINYSFALMAADPWTEELTADKWWFDDAGRIEHESKTLATYSIDWPEFEKDVEHEHALLDQEGLLRTYQEQGLEAAMHRAESIAFVYGEIDRERTDGRLFLNGPQDRFTTLREAELSGTVARPSGVAQLDITGDDTTEIQTISAEPESWDELLQRNNVAEPEIERHYWQLQIHQAETTEGTPLGYALFCTEYPELPPDFDEYLDKYGMDDSIYPTQARTVEMADFKTEVEARKFSEEFRQYLIPGVIDGPELAPDVALLEGLSGKWEEMDYLEIVDSMGRDYRVTREPDQWHLHLQPEEHQRLDQIDNSLFAIDF